VIENGIPADEIDTGSPHPARVYDYWLGGWDNYEADRVAARRITEIIPRIVEVARLNREFMARATRFVVEQGIRQIIDIGAGIPTSPNIHEVAHEVNPDVKVVYVDNDPIVRVHGDALLSQSGSSTFVLGDLRNPAAIVSHPRLRELIDFGQPVAYALIAVMHFVDDEDDPAGTIATLRDAVPRGSYLMMSHATPEFDADHEAHKAVWDGSSVRLSMRSREEVTALFSGFDFIEPGLVKVPLWHPTQRGPIDASWMGMYGGVGVKNG
jgi:hypothetical protein